MECKKCGNFINDDAKFCPYCGSAQSVFKDLVTRAMEGEDQAIAELYSRTIEKVYFAVRVLIKDEDTANDIVQDSYIKGFKSLYQLKDADSYQAWMKRIAHNKAVDWLRGQKVTYVEEFTSTDEAEVQERMEERIEYLPEDSADQRETARLLKEILDTLPEEQRVVLCMYYYDQMSSHEIAEELGISMNTVKSRLIYARKKVELQVRELESKGTKLYSLAPIPFFIALLHTAEKSAAEIPGAAVFQAVRAGAARAIASGAASAGELVNEGGKEFTRQAAEQTGAEVSRAGAQKVATESARTAARSAGKAAISGAAKAGAGAAGKGVALKGIAAALAVTMAGGGAAVGVKVGGQYFEKKQEERLQEEQRLAALSVTPTPEPTPTPEATPTPEPTPTPTQEELAEIAKARDLQLYQGVLEKFKSAMQHKELSREQLEQIGLSELTYISYQEKLVPTAGYALLDVDQNGVYELALLDTEENLGWNDEYSGHTSMDREGTAAIYCLYTLKDGNPVLLAKSDFRERFHLLEDGYIYDYLNGGMINVSRDFLRINDSSDGLVEVEGLHYSEAGEAANNPNLSWSYMKAGDVEAKNISEEQAHQIQDKYRPEKLNVIPLYE